MAPSHRTAVLVALLGLAAVSHAVIFIRLADEAPALLIALARVAIATAVFLPFAMSGARRMTVDRRSFFLALAAGGFLALHFAGWITSLERVSIAESALLVSLTPIWLAAVDLLRGRGRPDGALAAAIGLCLLGTAVIGWDGFRRATGDPVGLGLALAGGVAMAGYLLCGKEVRARLPTSVYVGLCYGTAATVLGVAVLSSGAPIFGYGTQTYIAMAALGLVAQVGGHTAYNWTLNRLSPVFVGICLLGEPVLGSILGWIYLSEAIPALTLAGGTAILLGLALAIRGEVRRT